MELQQRALQYLRDTKSFDVEGLKDSILSNGYVPLERLVVEVYNEDEDGPRYLVIEGNRRVAAVLALLDEHRGGAIDMSELVLASLEELLAVEIVGAEDERRAYKQTIMAIRHIAGIREWGAYQQGKASSRAIRKRSSTIQ